MYPLGAAFANDNVDPDRRVGLSAILYMVYGIGACVGPLVAGLLMREINPSMYFVFVSASTGLLVIFLRPQRITGDHLSQDAPTQFVPMSDSLQTSNVVAALDPRVDLESDVSFEPVDPDEPLQPAVPAEDAGPAAADQEPVAADPALVPSGPDAGSGPAKTAARQPSPRADTASGLASRSPDLAEAPRVQDPASSQNPE
jgi:hypothetical protein